MSAGVRKLGAIAFGANLGDRERTLKGALARVEKIAGVVVLRRTAWAASEPQGGPADQPEYLNGVALIETTLGGIELLEACQAIETHFGRDRSREERFGPRSLDLDILFLEGESGDGERLILPHPRIEERAFVLGPLAQLAPGTVLASGRSAAEAWAAVAPPAPGAPHTQGGNA